MVGVKSVMKKDAPKIGILGEGQDYNSYKMSLIERIKAFIIGFSMAFLASYIMFKSPIMSIILGIAGGCFAMPIFNEHLLKKRKKNLLLQFRELLEALSNSFSVGRNTPGAFDDALNDIIVQLGEEADIVKEVRTITMGLHNNITIEDLLEDFANRSGLDDVESFAVTFSVANRLGGNLKNVIKESRDIINDKIEIEMEIETLITGKKNEINIMAVLPFAVVGMMGLLGDAGGGNDAVTVVTKIIALGLFGFAYFIGRKITDIRM